MYIHFDLPAVQFEASKGRKVIQTSSKCAFLCPELNTFSFQNEDKHKQAASVAYESVLLINSLLPGYSQPVSMTSSVSNIV